MLSFIPVNVIGCQSLINCEKGDIVYLRALGGISQARIEEIRTTFRFDYYTAFASGTIYAKFLLPDGTSFTIDSSDTANWVRVPHFYLSYEDCRQERNQLGYTVHDHHAVGKYLINLIREKYGVDYKLSEFLFYAPTKNGIRMFPASKVIYTHDSEPLQFNIYDKYIGDVYDLSEEYGIKTTREEVMEHYRPKLTTFEKAPEPTFRKVRVTKVCEMLVPADEVENYIANINADEIDSDDWETSTEIIK